MKNDLKIGIALYAIADYMAALLAWFLFLYYRKNNTIEIDFTHFLEDLSSKDIFFTLLLVPISWLILHLFSGAYFNPYRKSRFIEIYRTLIISILGSFIFYFLFILNDTNKDYSYYTKSFFIYFIIQYFLTTIGRILVLRQTKNKINQGKFGYNTLIIGGNQQAIGIYKDIKNNEVNLGYTFKGFVYADDSGANG